MAPNRRSAWLRGTLDLLVLAALVDRERYGYELAQRLESRGLGRVKGGTLYPLLARLETAGLVSSAWSAPKAGPVPRVYELTPAGRQALERSAAGVADLQGLIAQYLTRFRKVSSAPAPPPAAPPAGAPPPAAPAPRPAPPPPAAPPPGTPAPRRGRPFHRGR